ATGNDLLDVSDSDGNNTLTAGNGNNEYLNASDSAGGNVLTVGNGNGDTLDATGAFGDNTFNIGTGSDTINGGDGNNTYVFSGQGSGSDLINSTDTGSNNSIIEFTAGVTPAGVTLAKAGNDLIVTAGSEAITVAGYFAGTGNDINAIEFADGTVWDQTYI